MNKQSRKELLKREDTFVVVAEQGAMWLTKHRTPMLALLAALVLLAGGIWGTSAYLHKRDVDAALVFSEGWDILENSSLKDDIADDDEADDDDADEPSHKDKSKDKAASNKAASKDKASKKAKPEEPKGPVFDTEKDKWLAARSKFDAVLQKAGHKGIGAMAAFLVGDLSDKLGEVAKAEEVYSELQKHLSPGDHLYFLAAERYAYLREKQGDRDGAIGALNVLAADDQHFYADYAQYHQARLYLAKNDKDKARGLLEHLEKSFPNSSLMEDVRAEIDELGGEDAAAALTPRLPAQEANAKGIE